MQFDKNLMSRRKFIEMATIAVASCSIVGVGNTESRGAKTIRLFDGKSLKGWLQSENSTTSLSSSQIPDLAALITKLANGSDPVSVFLRAQLDAPVRASLASYSAIDPDAKLVVSALVKNLNQIISGPSIYDKARFGEGVILRPETRKLLKENPHGAKLAQLNKLLIEDAYVAEITPSAFIGWTVRDGSMASLGTGRGVIYSAQDFSRFRLMFTMRHVSGKPDHQAACSFSVLAQRVMTNRSMHFAAFNFRFRMGATGIIDRARTPMAAPFSRL